MSFMKNKLYLITAIWLAGVCPALAQATPEEHWRAGNGFYTAKDYKQALRYYEAALDADPGYWPAFQGLGNCHYVMGDKAKALSNYQRCLSLHADNPELASFTAALRAEIEASKAAPRAEDSPEETEKILRVASGRSEEHFELSPSVGVVASGSTLWFGGGGGGFYMFAPEFGVGGFLHLYLYNDDFESASLLEIVPAVKFRPEGNGIKPFLVAGAGFAGISVNSHTNTYGYGGGPSGSGLFLLLMGGCGLEFPLQSDLGLFVGGRLNYILGLRATATYIPLELGLNFNL
jgi:tetratricopeptide (TPR) repeat protein